jgi:phosphoribosylformylglycinamidine (FGAM) synthase-like enzyme
MVTIKPATQLLREIIRAELAPIREETVKVLDEASVPAGGVNEFTVSSLAEHSALILTVKATYNAAATAGVRVRWLYSADNVNFDSPEDAESAGNYEDLTFLAGASRQRTVVVPLFQPYVKIQIVNKDVSYSVTVSCWRTSLR